MKFLSRYERKKKFTNGAQIYFDTLEQFSDDGGGRYEISAVKLLKTTPNFDKFSEEKTGCQISQRYGECYHINLMNYTKIHCGCIPFHVKDLSEFENVSTKIKI